MAPRNEEPAAGKSLREVQQNVETLKTEVQSTRVRKEATYIHNVAVGRYYRTGVDVGDGFGDRTSACREYTGPLADFDSRIFAAFKQRTITGPVLQDHSIKCLGICGAENQKPSTTSATQTSW